MKVGSLVELIDDKWDSKDYRGEIYPVKNKIYTVREIDTSYKCIRLEEIVNTPQEYCDFGNYVLTEAAFKIRRFRELQPPIEEVEELREILKPIIPLPA